MKVRGQFEVVSSLLPHGFLGIRLKSSDLMPCASIHLAILPAQQLLFLSTSYVQGNLLSEWHIFYLMLTAKWARTTAILCMRKNNKRFSKFSQNYNSKCQGLNLMICNHCFPINLYYLCILNKLFILDGISYSSKFFILFLEL